MLDRSLDVGYLRARWELLLSRGEEPINETMPYYVTDLIANPNPALGLLPRGWDKTSAWSILKLDKVKIVLWASDAIVAAGITLIGLDGTELIGAAARTALANLAGDGRTIKPTLGEAIGDLLVNPPE